MKIINFIRLIFAVPVVFIGFYIFSIGCIIAFGIENYKECSREFNKTYLKIKIEEA